MSSQGSLRIRGVSRNALYKCTILTLLTYLLHAGYARSYRFIYSPMQAIGYPKLPKCRYIIPESPDSDSQGQAKTSTLTSKAKLKAKTTGPEANGFKHMTRKKN